MSEIQLAHFTWGDSGPGSPPVRPAAHEHRTETRPVPPAGASGAPPTPGEVVASGAGALFVARARAVDPCICAA